MIPEGIDTSEHHQPPLLQLQDFILQGLIQLVQEGGDVHRLLHDGFLDGMEPEFPLLSCSKASSSGRGRSRPQMCGAGGQGSGLISCLPPFKPRGGYQE